MSAKRVLITILVASIVMMVVGSGVASAGGPIGSDFRISNQGVEAVFSSAAYNSQRQEYLVVWYNDRPGNDDIQAQRLSKSGSKIRGPFYVIAGQGAERRYPDVTYNSQRNEYLVVWEHKHGAEYSIRAQRVSATGQLLGGEVTVASPPTFNDAFKKPTVGYASTSNKYLVVWEYHWEFGAEVAGQRLSSTAAVEGSIIGISPDPVGAPRYEPDLAYNRSRNEYLVVWKQRDPGPGLYDIYGRRVQGNGTPMHPESILIRRGEADETAPAVAAIPTTPNQGLYLVVWEETVAPGDINVHGRRMTGEGSPMGASKKVIASSTENETNPAVAGSEGAGQFLVTWTRRLTDPQAPWVKWDLIYGRAVAKGGAFLGQGTHVGGRYDADHAAVVSGPLGDFLVAFDDDPAATGNVDIYGRLWGNRAYVPLVLRRHR